MRTLKWLCYFVLSVRTIREIRKSYFDIPKYAQIIKIALSRNMMSYGHMDELGLTDYSISAFSNRTNKSPPVFYRASSPMGPLPKNQLPRAKFGQPQIRPLRPQITDRQAEERMDGWTNVPCVLQDFVPFGAAAQKLVASGQNVVSDTRCPALQDNKF